ncbi:hypothetical protein P152DRAFT_72374 [Eremomyces bilateralis CBS 781.70]|uniref:Uncharacterized protein n=1 Tax=Eremomyces bilateralis CBS 781.70 TaxID=1392243 RepID=A0A6G1FZG2_9PEZI|nr:uncharacterized protein P152DRAFT_72374 [Eremomyces bilateralis CBS 781.70]KAF1810949.1 hypothetical protein P152DRAFT_72374 [Eremomyces bilateralis CBS 781.70]
MNTASLYFRFHILLTTNITNYLKIYPLIGLDSPTLSHIRTPTRRDALRTSIVPNAAACKAPRRDLDLIVIKTSRSDPDWRIERRVPFISILIWPVIIPELLGRDATAHASSRVLQLWILTIVIYRLPTPFHLVIAECNLVPSLTVAMLLSDGGSKAVRPFDVDFVAIQALNIRTAKLLIQWIDWNIAIATMDEWMMRLNALTHSSLLNVAAAPLTLSTNSCSSGVLGWYVYLAAQPSRSDGVTLWLQKF